MRSSSRSGTTELSSRVKAASIRTSHVLLLGVASVLVGCGDTYVSLGSLDCASFGAVFAATEGTLWAEYDDCSSNQGPVDIRVVVMPGCEARCMVFRSHGIDNPADWRWTSSCQALPPRTSDVRAVADFIDELCAWHLVSSTKSGLTDCNPDCVTR